MLNDRYKAKTENRDKNILISQYLVYINAKGEGIVQSYRIEDGGCN